MTGASALDSGLLRLPIAHDETEAMELVAGTESARYVCVRQWWEKASDREVLQDWERMD